jgi:hypothetical protein
MQGMNRRQATLWLSEPRYKRLLAQCEGDHRSAVALYEWHAELSAASFKLIHHFEVLLRNAVDGILGELQPEAPIAETWLLDFEILRLEGIRRVIGAIERLDRGKPITRGGVVAGLSFAFWAGLFGRPYEELWRHRLRHAFPASRQLVRTTISRRMKELQRFRNRVAHHDSLLRQDVPSRLEDMLDIAGWIDPAARAWLEEQTDAPALARARPAVLLPSSK